jgi:hypothetical protein
MLKPFAKEWFVLQHLLDGQMSVAEAKAQLVAAT